MPVQSANTFLSLVSRSGLAADTTLEEAFAGSAPADPNQAAETLVEKGILTPFQARVLLSGRHKGLVLGPYRILNEIGRGGMGIVYLAEHQKLQRQVALKVLPKDSTADPLALDRFYREARAVAALDHPNIVKAYDVAEDSGVHYFVMEYVQGVNLQAYVDRKGPIPWKSAVGFIAQACRGLQHAHERQLVHRDIKPGNLLVDKQNTLKILDMGLARCFHKEQDNLTFKYASHEELTGSVDYMAPEVALGEQAVDIRSDIYSLGVTLYTLIVGRPPFEGSAAQKLMQHQMKRLPLLHELRPEVPETLSVVLSRMTQKQPEHRYDTPAAVLDALAPWLQGSMAPRSAQARAVAQPVAQAVLPTAEVIATPTERVDRSASRETRPIASEDTRDHDTMRRPNPFRKRERKRREQRRRARLIKTALWCTIPPLIIVPLAIWGIVALVDHLNEKQPEPQVAAAKPGDAARRPERGGRPERPDSPPVGGAPSTPMAPPQAPQNPNEGLEVGQLAPDIEGEDLDGIDFRLSDYRDRIVLLDFWGFW